MTTVTLYSSGLLKKICNLQLEFKIVTEKKERCGHPASKKIVLVFNTMPKYSQITSASLKLKHNCSIIVRSRCYNSQGLEGKHVTETDKHWEK